MITPRLQMPKYEYCDISSADVIAALGIDPVLISYSEKEKDLDRAIERGNAFAKAAREKAQAIDLQINDLEAQIAVLNRERREHVGEVKSARYKIGLAEKHKAQLDRRWKTRELAIYKKLITGKLRSMNKELLPTPRFAKKPGDSDE